MRKYKTSAAARKKALAYYYKNREACRERQENWRRAQGIAPRRVMTEAEKVSRALACRECGVPVTAPSWRLNGVRLCWRCRKRLYPPTHRANVRARYQALKENRGCDRCGVRKGLDFHHRDPAAKIEKVSRLVGRMGWGRVLEEIEKCDLLCKKHHDEAHGH